jgi:hypothetical protein
MPVTRMSTNTRAYKIIPHAENNLIEVEWYGNTTSQQFREGTLEMLNALEKNNASKIIMDMEKLSFSVTQEDHDWLKEFYVPAAIKSNLRSIAFVEPGFFNTLSIANILYPYFPDQINFEIFESFEAASLWILKH